MSAPELRTYRVSIGAVTISVDVEARDDEEALELGLESIRQARESDLEESNLSVEEVPA